MLCLLLHFYQPSNQIPKVLNDVIKSCYIPLIKVIKENKKLFLNANIPLALLENLDHMGYRDLIKDIAFLVEQGRLELTGTGAYHPLLTKLPQEMALRQIIMNEAGYGYYFGSDKDFEGEDCLMVKNVKGFFPPEAACNEDLVKIISEIGYEWVLLDEFCLPETLRQSHKSGIYYTLSNCSIKVLVRNRGLSNLLAFNRSFNVQDIANNILNNGEGSVIALDAETFGHHYREGVGFFDAVMLELSKRGVDFLTISQAIKYMDEKKTPHILESTWSTVDDNVYSLWLNNESLANKALWDLFNFFHSIPEVKRGLNDSDFNGGKEGKEGKEGALNPLDFCGGKVTPLWLQGQKRGPYGELLLNVLKLEQSDAFWWSALGEVAGKINNSKYMLISVLEYYKKVLPFFPAYSSELLQKISEVEQRASALL